MAIDMIGIAICTQCYQVLAIATHAFLYTVMLILVVLTQDIPGQPGQMATLIISIIIMFNLWRTGQNKSVSLW